MQLALPTDISHAHVQEKHTQVYIYYAYLALVIHICSSINQCFDNLGMSITTRRDEDSEAVLIL